MRLRCTPRLYLLGPPGAIVLDFAVHSTLNLCVPTNLVRVALRMPHRIVVLSPCRGGRRLFTALSTMRRGRIGPILPASIS